MFRGKPVDDLPDARTLRADAFARFFDETAGHT
jgi:hypothetical protein